MKIWTDCLTVEFFGDKEYEGRHVSLKKMTMHKSLKLRGPHVEDSHAKMNKND